MGTVKIPERISRDELHALMKTILYDIDGQIWYELKAAKHQADRLNLLSQVDVLKRFANRIEAYFGPGVDNAK